MPLYDQHAFLNAPGSDSEAAQLAMEGRIGQRMMAHSFVGSPASRASRTTRALGQSLFFFWFEKVDRLTAFDTNLMTRTPDRDFASWQVLDVERRRDESTVDIDAERDQGRQRNSATNAVQDVVMWGCRGED